MSAAWETNTSSEGGYVSQLTYLLFIIYLFWDAAECNQCRNIRAFPNLTIQGEKTEPLRSKVSQQGI